MGGKCQSLFIVLFLITIAQKVQSYSYFENMKRFKMFLHRMGRIGHTPMGKGVCSQQVAEFIMDGRDGNAVK